MQSLKTVNSVLIQVLEEWKTVLDLIVAAGGASAIMFALWVWSRPRFSNLLTFWSTFKKMQEDLTFVKGELSNNGGGSVKDAVMRSERKIEEISRDLNLVKGIQRAMMNRTKIGFFETDEKGRFVWVSRHYLEMTGKQLGDVLVNGWGASIALDQRHKVISEWDDCVKHDRDFEMEYDIVASDGSHKTTVKGYAKRVRNMDGITIGFAGSIVEKETESQNELEPAFV